MALIVAGGRGVVNILDDAATGEGAGVAVGALWIGDTFVGASPLLRAGDGGGVVLGPPEGRCETTGTGGVFGMVGITAVRMRDIASAGPCLCALCALCAFCALWADGGNGGGGAEGFGGGADGRAEARGGGGGTDAFAVGGGGVEGRGGGRDGFERVDGAALPPGIVAFPLGVGGRRGGALIAALGPDCFGTVTSSQPYSSSSTIVSGSASRRSASTVTSVGAGTGKEATPTPAEPPLFAAPFAPAEPAFFSPSFVTGALYEARSDSDSFHAASPRCVAVFPGCDPDIVCGWSTPTSRRQSRPSA